MEKIYCEIHSKQVIEKVCLDKHCLTNRRAIDAFSCTLCTRHEQCQENLGLQDFLRNCQSDICGAAEVVYAQQQQQQVQQVKRLQEAFSDWARDFQQQIMLFVQSIMQKFVENAKKGVEKLFEDQTNDMRSNMKIKCQTIDDLALVLFNHQNKQFERKYSRCTQKMQEKIDRVAGTLPKHLQDLFGSRCALITDQEVSKLKLLFNLNVTKDTDSATTEQIIGPSNINSVTRYADSSATQQLSSSSNSSSSQNLSILQQVDNSLSINNTQFDQLKSKSQQYQPSMISQATVLPQPALAKLNAADAAAFAREELDFSDSVSLNIQEKKRDQVLPFLKQEQKNKRKIHPLQEEVDNICKKMEQEIGSCEYQGLWVSRQECIRGQYRAPQLLSSSTGALHNAIELNRQMVTLLSQYTDFDSEKVKNIALYVHFIEVFIELKDKTIDRVPKTEKQLAETLQSALKKVQQEMQAHTESKQCQNEQLICLRWAEGGVAAKTQCCAEAAQLNHKYQQMIDIAINNSANKMALLKYADLPEQLWQIVLQSCDEVN